MKRATEVHARCWQHGRDVVHTSIIFSKLSAGREWDNSPAQERLEAESRKFRYGAPAAPGLSRPCQPRAQRKPRGSTGVMFCLERSSSTQLQIGEGYCAVCKLLVKSRFFRFFGEGCMRNSEPLEDVTAPEYRRVRQTPLPRGGRPPGVIFRHRPQGEQGRTTC